MIRFDVRKETKFLLFVVVFGVVLVLWIGLNALLEMRYRTNGSEVNAVTVQLDLGLRSVRYKNIVRLYRGWGMRENTGYNLILTVIPGGVST